MVGGRECAPHTTWPDGKPVRGDAPQPRPPGRGRRDDLPRLEAPDTPESQRPPFAPGAEAFTRTIRTRTHRARAPGPGPGDGSASSPHAHAAGDRDIPSSLCPFARPRLSPPVPCPRAHPWRCRPTGPVSTSQPALARSVTAGGDCRRQEHPCLQSAGLFLRRRPDTPASPVYRLPGTSPGRGSLLCTLVRAV